MTSSNSDRHSHEGGNPVRSAHFEKLLYDTDYLAMLKKSIEEVCKNAKPITDMKTGDDPAYPFYLGFLQGFGKKLESELHE
jgi:hypothetical protein